jgi:hypothetical protein
VVETVKMDRPDAGVDAAITVTLTDPAGTLCVLKHAAALREWSACAVLEGLVSTANED